MKFSLRDSDQWIDIVSFLFSLLFVTALESETYVIHIVLVGRVHAGKIFSVVHAFSVSSVLLFQLSLLLILSNGCTSCICIEKLINTSKSSEVF
jgi:hypothetical protein